MKKLLILSNLFWISLVGIYTFNSCKPSRSDNSTEKNSNTIKPTEIVLDYEGQNFVSLPVSTAQLLADNYTKNYLNLINKTYNTSDARSIWFSLDDLKNFIWQIEYHAVNAGADIEPKSLGVRMYYAQYPTSDEIKNNASLNIIPEYGSKHTLFMVPTVLKDSVNMEFDPRKLFKNRKPGEKNTILPLRPKNDKNNGYFSFIQDDGSTIMNHGGLCPPCRPPSGY